MELPEISLEQNNIIQQLSTNNNVVVDSVAGSGKTTCNLHIAKHFNNMNILLLTYNAKLKLETRSKTIKLSIGNIEVHSYHSFCVKYYDNQCFNDTKIIELINKNTEPVKHFNFDLIVLDEAQDITKLYYELICKIYNNNTNINTKICIFGDKKQSIFSFNGADERYIEYAEELFRFNTYNWITCHLPVSFRITYEMSLFINNCLLKEEYIISNKITNNKPRYIICDCFGDDMLEKSSRTYEEVEYYFNLGYKPNDIFILAPSVKGGGSPIRRLENKIKLKRPDVNVYVPTNDDEKLDEELLEEKIIFSTFHQTKGLERKVVIIFNFDDSYFQFYKKDANPCVCSNELYVATTRGIEHLTLFHHNKNEYLRFIDKTNIQKYCYFENSPFFKPTIKSLNKTKNIETSITDVIKFLPQNIIDDCFNQLEINQFPDYTINKMNIPLKTSNEITFESVSEITGIAIPSMFELKLKNKMNIFKLLVQTNFEKTHNTPKEKKYNINNINIKTITPEELLYLSNCWNTHKNGYIFKIYQITNYSWLQKNELDECMNRLDKLKISMNSLFEYYISAENEQELLNRNLIGYIDCVDKENNIVYEFKCVQKLEKEHYLQLAIYMYLYELKKQYIENIENISNGETKYILFNILTNEYINIKCEFQKLKKMIEYLIYSKYIIDKPVSNDNFIEINKNIYKSYFDYKK